MDQGQKSIKEDQGEVVVIFCDICNFTEMISEIGTGIVELLDTLFRKFDDLSTENGAQKIEVFAYPYFRPLEKHIWLPQEFQHVNQVFQET